MTVSASPTGGALSSLTATTCDVLGCVWSTTCCWRDRLARAANADPHAHVGLGIVALVGDRHVERDARADRRRVGLVGHERRRADRDGLQAVTVGAREGLDGAAVARAAAGLRVDPPGDGRRREPAEVLLEVRVLDGLAADAVLVEHLLDERRGAPVVDDVGGREGLHLAGDRGHGRDGGGGVRRQGGGQLLGDLAHRLLDQRQREEQVALCGGHVARDADALGLLGEALGAEAQLVDVRLHIRRGVVRAAGKRREELVGVGVGLLDDARHVAVVVLQRLLLAALQAAVDAEHEEQHDDDADPERRDAAHHELLGIGGWPDRGRRRAARPDAGRAGLVIVEEGQGRSWRKLAESPV